MFWENLPIVWIVIAVLLLGAEMLTGTFYLLVMGIAAAVGAFAAWMGAPLPLQIVLAIVVGVAGAMLVWRWHKSKKREQKPADNNLDVGQVVVWKGTYPDGTWQVFYRGAQWQAKPARPETDPEQPLSIVETEGNLLVVDNRL